MSTLKFNRWQSIDGVTRNSVLQVVAQENVGQANTYTNTTSATYVDMLNMTASITPTSATSKIMIVSTGSGLCRGSATEIGFRMLANGSVVWQNSRWAFTNVSASLWSPISWASTSLHSPATASSITYKFQFNATGGTTPEARIGNAPSVNDPTYTAVFLMEIAQ